MRIFTRRILSRSSAVAIVACSAMVLAACTSAPGPRSTAKKTGTKEYFAESEYGVKASPRVSNQRSRLPRGGGRDMVGKAYKVRGKWYKPKEEPGYSKVGAASWYGDAFHGRLTANGEIYDMTHLTAAHPTMPLPSYARVTNTKNGNSIIVRVNDRGPFANNRIIDLSKRAAELLDYTHAGVAKVKVDYVGRAPLHGRDDQYLMASYRPGKNGPSQLPAADDGLPAGVMIAMNGTTPTRRTVNRPRSLFAVLPGRRAKPMATLAAAPVAAAPALALASNAPAGSNSFNLIEAGDPILPDFGPYVPERPIGGIASDADRLALPIMSYADRRISEAAADPFRAFGAPNFNANEILASWKRARGVDGDTVAATTPPGEYLAAGTFGDMAEARQRVALLAELGKASIIAEAGAYSVVMQASGKNLDELARRAWAKGATDAFIVHFE